jgi:hypothetical protein
MNELRKGKAQKLIRAGSQLGGAAVGGALGFLAGDPLTAAVAATAGSASTKVLADIADRTLSQRETIRVGATAAIAMASIKERLEAEQSLRDDGFFEAKDGERSDAEQVLEGVLLKAKNEHEEKKSEHLGWLYSNIAFDRWCSVEEANGATRTASELTYAQFVLMHVYHNTSLHNLLEVRGQPGDQVPYGTLSIMQATFDLANRGLILLRLPGQSHGEIVLDLNQVVPAHFELSVIGTRLHDLLSLDRVPVSDVNSVSKHISSDPKKRYGDLYHVYELNQRRQDTQ